MWSCEPADGELQESKVIGDNERMDDGGTKKTIVELMKKVIATWHLRRFLPLRHLLRGSAAHGPSATVHLSGFLSLSLSLLTLTVRVLKKDRFFKQPESPFPTCAAVVPYLHRRGSRTAAASLFLIQGQAFFLSDPLPLFKRGAMQCLAGGVIASLSVGVVIGLLLLAFLVYVIRKKVWKKKLLSEKSRMNSARVKSVAMAYVDDDASSGSGDNVNILDGHKRQAGMPSNSCGGRKRGRKATGAAIVDAMLEIAAASKMRTSAIVKNEERFSISKCIKVLDEMQGVDERIYFLALDLFENHPNAREVFISLRDKKRLLWLQRKCGVSSNTPISMDDIDLELDETELVVAAAAAAGGGYYYYSCLTKLPAHGLSPGRCEFITDVLNGHDDFCREMLRMIQRDIVIAGCVFHNFIRHEERNDWIFSSIGGSSVEKMSDLDELPDVPILSTIQEQLAFSVRDSITTSMWDDYLTKWDEW
ncbi:hypothetical protein VNO78_12614 [Psophocarpus tetragonolobus]|uniref:Uncharacterized protein n=1 Tax=Psophocarpus tetragonolobus TaxID=3891 RepID=A0AAN9SWJ3_PSOTE